MNINDSDEIYVFTSFDKTSVDTELSTMAFFTVNGKRILPYNMSEVEAQEQCQSEEDGSSAFLQQRLPYKVEVSCKQQIHNPFGHENTYEAYVHRQAAKDNQASRMEHVSQMRKHKDFDDRLFYFLAELTNLLPGQRVSDLPHFGQYFSTTEVEELAKFNISNLSDPNATPQDILNSLEPLYPSFANKKIYISGPIPGIVNCPGIWRMRDDDHHWNWLQNDKVVVSGTLMEPQAAEKRAAHLENMAIIEKEIEEEQEKARAENARQQRAKERRAITREKNKSLAAETPNVETPNVETSNVETSNVETSNVETPDGTSEPGTKDEEEEREAAAKRQRSLEKRRNTILEKNKRLAAEKAASESPNVEALDGTSEPGEEEAQEAAAKRQRSLEKRRNTIQEKKRKLAAEKEAAEKVASETPMTESLNNETPDTETPDTDIEMPDAEMPVKTSIKRVQKNKRISSEGTTKTPVNKVKAGKICKGALKVMLKLKLPKASPATEEKEAGNFQ
jgi:hypothetical protein